MDKIELVVTHQMGSPADRVWSAIFGMAGGTIGRAGQNKLVLPDADAEVARVHAMVRLDSDQAYIANLCERRSVLVNGLEVLSGQEVPLMPGAEIGIGPYTLRACLPGELRGDTPSRREHQPVNGVTTLPLQQMHSPATPGLATAETTTLNLASLPNPWADIPAIVGGETCVPELADLPTIHRPAADPDASSDNPFAMLGRVEALDSASLEQNSPLGASEVNPPTKAVVHPDPVPKQLNSSNPFEKHLPASTAPHSKAVEHRAMVIPDDFDPFAADPKVLASANDAWSGDLAAKSLAEVAQLKNDELLQSLPRTSQFAGEMDNAAHTGLPKQLDPAIELNPLKLFREPGESMYAEAEDHGLSRGSDLAQIFSMPREARSGLGVDSAVAKITPVVHASKATESAVAAGLQPTQGLDLALFGSATPDSTPEFSFINVSDPVAAVGSEPHATASLRPTSAAHEAGSEERGNPLQSKSHRTDSINGFASNEHASAGLSNAMPSPRPADPAPATLRPEPINGEPEVSISMQALASAFLEGAGITPDRVALSITPDFMRGFGEALRTAVQGSIDLLSARSEIKREFRADVTIIASGANNPLKFLPTADGVMLQLTGQTFPGFMKPVPAMKEAYKDLAVHQVALMAGIRAAYEEATARLSPVELEKSAGSSPSVMSRISSVHRKAALWDDYQQRYESIRRHAEDDLMAFSGKTFVEAYENAAQAAEETL